MFQRVGTATEKAQVQARVLTLTTSENQMNRVIWVWVLEKGWKIDTKVLWKKEFDKQW